jgi:peroxidase
MDKAGRFKKGERTMNRNRSNRKREQNRALRRKPREFTQHAADVLEPRVLLSATTAPAAAPVASSVESFNGSGNNIANPTWGEAGTDLIRLTPAQYANGINSPSLPQDPSARLISNIVNNQADPADPSEDIATVDQNSLSDFGYAFGQFIDHDLDLTQGTGASDPISVPVGDPIGGPNDTPLAFQRSATDPATGTSTSNPLQNPTSVTSYLDLSQVYGSDLATDNALRTFSGGQMKTSPGGLPPLDNSTYFTSAQLAAINASVGGMADDGPLPESQMFVTGDSRGNENLELTALQTLFLDNHNRIAAQLQKENPTWTDQQLFDEARKLNIAEYQQVIYTEWLPAVLGQNALPAYKGYNPNVNATIADEFSTVAFRFGHSLLSGDIERDGNDGLSVAADVPLEQDFFDPNLLNGEGQPGTTDPITGLMSTDISAVLKGDADGNSQASDVQVINEVRDELFNEVVPGVGYGQDLVALDIQRGRDQGIGSYNEVREALGLPAVTSFAQITSNVTVQKELQEAYGNVNNIDAFEGGLAEDHVAGSDVGPLFQAILVNQFTRLRDGDRFFYLNETFSPAEMAILNQGNTLAKVIEANTNITNLQSDVFLFKASISGTVNLNLFGGNRGGIGLPGLTVQLEDTSGDILATTTTGHNGSYSFNQLSTGNVNLALSPGVSGTGTYQVVVVLPSFLQQVGQGPGTVKVTRGGQNFNNVDFELGLNFSGASKQSLQADISSLQTLLSGPGTQSPSGGKGGGSASGGGGFTNVVTATSPASSLTGLLSDPSSVLAALAGTSTTPATSGGASAETWTAGSNTGVISSTDSSGASSSGAGGSTNPSDKPLDAAFQEFQKIADLLK